jgi:hypothetical protein
MLDLFNLAIAGIVVTIVAFMVRAVRHTRASMARADTNLADVQKAVSSQRDDKVARITGSILLIGGLGFLGASAITYRQQAAFVDASQRAAGVVIDNQWRDNRIQSGDETPGGWAPVVRFEDAGNNAITFTSNVSRYPSPKYAVGEAVQVLYDPGDSGHAEVSDFVTLWLIPLVLLGLGSAMTLFGGILLRSVMSS